MKLSLRVGLGVVLVVVDLVTFFVPLTAVFAFYILVARPDWFLDFIDEVYGVKKLCS